MTTERASRWGELVRRMRTWKRGEERAVHKPLLTLMLLSRAQRGLARVVPYTEIEAPLRRALQDFGAPGGRHHPEYPFWYLKNDGFWKVRDEKNLPSRAGKVQPTHRALVEHDATAEVPELLWRQLADDPKLIAELARTILDEFWPETYHEDIADALTLDLGAVAGVRWTAKRDPNFRDLILRAYESRCAFCGYDGRLGNTMVGVEAAHVQFKQDRGPDVVENGLCLCSLHHKVFDRGGMGLDHDHRILVSQDLTGHEIVAELVVRYAGRHIQGPQPAFQPPATPYVEWHGKNVFRGPARSSEPAP